MIYADIVKMYKNYLKIILLMYKEGNNLKKKNVGNNSNDRNKRLIYLRK